METTFLSSTKQQHLSQMSKQEQQTQPNKSQNMNKSIFSVQSQIMIKNEVYFSMYHKDYVVGLCFTRDGSYLVTGCYNGYIFVWDLSQEGQLVKSVKSLNHMQVISFSKKCKFFATGGDNMVKVYQYKRLKEDPIIIIKNYQDSSSGGSDISSIKFSNDSKIIAFGNLNGYVYLYSMEKKEDQWHSEHIAELFYHRHFVNCISFSTNDKYLYSGSLDGHISVYNIHSNQRDIFQVQQFQKHAYAEKGIRCIDVCEYYIAVGWGKFIDVFNAINNSRYGVLQGHAREVFCLLFKEDGKILISGGWDNTVKVWSMDTFQIVQSIQRENVSTGLGIFYPNLLAEGVKIQVDNPRMVFLNPMEGNEKMKIAVVSQEIPNEDKFSFAFKIISLNSKDGISVGICYNDIVEQENYIFDHKKKGHGCYMVQSDGIMYSHHDFNINGVSQGHLLEIQRQIRSTDTNPKKSKEDTQINDDIQSNDEQSQDNDELKEKSERMEKSKAMNKSQNSKGAQSYDKYGTQSSILDMQKEQFVYSYPLTFEQGDYVECSINFQIKQLEFINKSQVNQMKQFHQNLKIDTKRKFSICCAMKNRADRVEVNDCHKDWIKSLAIYPTQKYFGTASRDCSAKVWKLIEL